MVNSCLDFLRKQKQFGDITALDDVSYKLEDESLSGQTLEVEDLLRMIEKLPRGYQVVFNLFAIEGYSHKEIAELLGISEETSKSQYFRARAHLKNYLEKIEVK